MESERLNAQLLERSNVTIRQIRAFVIVAELKSFTRAAAHVHITQSAISALVKELEFEVGVRLFDRTTRHVELTAAGRDLLPVALRILHDLADGLEAVRDLSSKRRGSVKVAVTPTLAAGFIPAVCVAFNALYPGVRISVHDRLASTNLYSLRSGDADLAIGTYAEVDTDIELRAVAAYSIHAIVSRAHAFASRSHLRWADLQGQPLITLSRESSFATLVQRELLRAGIVPSLGYEVAYQATAIRMAAAGMGLAICPCHAVQLSGQDDIASLPITEPEVVHQVSVATLAGRELSASAQSFREMVVAFADRLGQTDTVAR